MDIEIMNRCVWSSLFAPTYPEDIALRIRSIDPKGKTK